MTEPGIAIVRVFDAPRERVWREWTEPKPFADWFGGAEAEVPLSSVAMDVRPGGSWRLTMFAGPERRRIDWKGEYREVVEPERLVFTVSDQPGDELYELVTVVLNDRSTYRTRTTWGEPGRKLTLDIDPSTHPAWTGGQQHLIDRGGRLTRFNKRFKDYVKG